MTDSRFPDLNERLDQLGRDLSRQPSVIATAMRQIRELPGALNDDATGEAIAELGSKELQGEPKDRLAGESSVAHGQGSRRRVLRLATFAAAASLILAIGVFVSRPRTLYAKAMDALSRVQTIHVTGWSRRVPRSWPLEKVKPASEDPNKQHAVDMWFWSSVDGTPRTFERYGPVTKIMIGESEKEYQQDVDLLYLAEGRLNDEAAEIAALANLLSELKDAKQAELGTKSLDGRTLRGVKVTRGGRSEEYWFDQASNLPVSYVRIGEDGEKQIDFTLSYDESVPPEVLAYSPPKASTVRYGGSHPDVNLAWKQHVQDLWLNHELPETGCLMVPREIKFGNSWTLQTPDENYTVFPVDSRHSAGMDLRHFVRNRVANRMDDCVRDGCDGVAVCNATTWRVDESLSEFMFPNCDLIVAANTPWQEWVQFFLNENGLKYTDVEEQRTIWIARHDGRELKPWQQVKPPVPYRYRGGKPMYGVVVPGRGHGSNYANGVTFADLFKGFNSDQVNGMRADGAILRNETGLPLPPQRDFETHSAQEDWEPIVSQYYVSTDVPYFPGKEGREMAIEWYRKEFGITFAEEKRTMTTHVIERK